jgi:hypothetical protein
MTLTGLGPDGRRLGLGSDNTLVLDAERDVRTTGTGFQAGSEVGLFIDPPKPTGAAASRSWVATAAARALMGTIDLGTLPVGADGSFAGEKTLPDGLKPGFHELQAVGYSPSGQQRVLTLGIIVRPWIVLDKGVRSADGRHDRIRTTGDSGGINAGAQISPFIRYTGQKAFSKGKAVITVQSNGTFTWTRKIRRDKGLTAYVADVDTKSNRVLWAARR